MGGHIDAKGLSCPQPVIETRKKMKELERGSFEVSVDTDTARENITRLARHEGWEVEVVEDDLGYLLILKKE